MNDSYYAFPSGNVASGLNGPLGVNHHQGLTPSASGSPSSGSSVNNLPFGGGHSGLPLPLMGLAGAVDLSEGGGVVVAAPSDPREAPDTKQDIEDEACPVCGDKVSGYHYGLLTCESCKGFFKRTVQNKKVYTCVGERTCHIDKSQRKRCPFCRFQKCLEVGMKLEAVRADRMRGGRNKFGPMYKRDRARKLQAIRSRQHVPHHGGHHSHSHHSHSRSSNSNCRMEGASSSGFLLPPSGGPGLPYELLNNNPAFMKTEMIQIPHLSSTNSPESMQMSGTDTSSNPARSWSTSYSPPSNFNQNGMQVNQNLSLNNNSPLPHNSDSGETGQVTLPGTVPELQQTLLDDRIWVENLYSLLHSQTYNQCEVDLFELLSKVLDQCLFAQVDWARNSAFFKELKVDDQMTLLQHSWSEMLILDFIYHRLRSNLPNETTLPNGQTFNILDLTLLGLSSNIEPLHNLTARLRELKFDRSDYVCLKFLLLLAPVTPGLNDRMHVQIGQEKVHGILLDHCLTNHPQMPERFSQLLLEMPELRMMANQGEEYLYYKHLTGAASTTTLLMELLLAKRKC